jgi:thiamine-monophosphate kinase
MHMLESITENRMINDLAKRFSRSPLQQNVIHESDAEIIKFPDNYGASIAVTIDSISEEIETGLYEDPYLIGWMTVMVNFSDIAASGAEPVGILISEIIPDHLAPEYIDKIQEGINDAVTRCGSFVLGGDTNSGDKLILTGCAIGRSSDNKYLKRTGCAVNDILYSTGKSGSGNAYAVTKLIKNNALFYKYLPSARIKEAAIIKKYASCCMDTSDGVITSLDQLMRLNNCGFKFKPDWINTIDVEAVKTAVSINLPEWLLLAGQHGEFELLFTIPKEKEAQFLDEAAISGWEPVRLGYVTDCPGIVMDLYNKTVTLDSCKLRNLPYHTGGNIVKYMEALLDYDKGLRESVPVND